MATTHAVTPQAAHGVVVIGSVADVVSITLTGSDQAISAIPRDYRGFSIRNTSTSVTALVRFFDNASAPSGDVLEEISLAASESAREFYLGGITPTNGIYASVTGSVTGCIRVGPA